MLPISMGVVNSFKNILPKKTVFIHFISSRKNFLKYFEEFEQKNLVTKKNNKILAFLQPIWYKLNVSCSFLEEWVFPTLFVSLPS